MTENSDRIPPIKPAVNERASYQEMRAFIGGMSQILSFLETEPEKTLSTKRRSLGLIRDYAAMTEIVANRVLESLGDGI